MVIILLLLSLSSLLSLIVSILKNILFSNFITKSDQIIDIGSCKVLLFENKANSS